MSIWLPRTFLSAPIMKSLSLLSLECLFITMQHIFFETALMQAVSEFVPAQRKSPLEVSLCYIPYTVLFLQALACVIEANKKLLTSHIFRIFIF